MPSFAIEGIRLAGISAAVPGNRVAVAGNSTVSDQDLAKIQASTGVKGRHLAAPEMCTSDLCANAALRLLEKLQWNRETVDLLIVVTQTGDYILPSTACSLHGRLGLAKHCAAFDINLGCSGYVYGLSVAAMHLRCNAASRVLLLAGDTISKVVSIEDRSVAFLFGDAGTATGIERFNGAPAMHFITGSDGSGAGHLLIPAGMFRNKTGVETDSFNGREGGSTRSAKDLQMDGAEIFNFTLREVPNMINAALLDASWSVGQVDAFILHQANKFILESLVKKMGLPNGKVIFALEDYGNTSSASIPLAICEKLKVRLAEAPARLILAGFGVGFSWASVAMQVDFPDITDVISVSSV